MRPQLLASVVVVCCSPRVLTSFFTASLSIIVDLTLANVELAQFKGANFKNTVAREMYVVGTTLFEGIKSIENSDWTDTELRKVRQWCV